ncbi:MAG: AAA family ATPase [Alphaproteobacteria bacterium]|nr:AAA family ATPase [Alphaproteobacteria bacterium]
MRPYVIVLGNEKGGTGKSTIAMHIAVYLLNQGFKVGTIDIDARQGTFTRYFENRKNNCSGNIKLSEHLAIFKDSSESNVEASQGKDIESIKNAFNKLRSCDFLVIDTPGNDTFLSRTVHSYADTLVTPVNESLIDIDVLVRVSQGDSRSMKPSIYAEMVWDQRKLRAIRREKPLDWIVVKNRMSPLYSNNRKNINAILETLSRRIGFRLSNGFCERVIFKELFASGLTLLDLEAQGVDLNISHVAARQELRDLINFMKLPKLSGRQ